MRRTHSLDVDHRALHRCTVDVTRTLMLSTFSVPNTRCCAVRSGMNADESGLWLPKPPPTLTKTPMTWNCWPFTDMFLPTSASGVVFEPPRYVRADHDDALALLVLFGREEPALRELVVEDARRSRAWCRTTGSSC